MKKPLYIIKTWFEEGDTPTQQQFYDTFDSFIHKDDGVMVTGKTVNDKGDVTFSFSDGESLTIEKFLPPDSQSIEYIDGLLDRLEGINQQLSSLQSNKQDAEAGKGLSEANFTPTEKEKLAGLFNYLPPTSQPIAFIEGLEAALADLQESIDLKQEAEDGKGLSDNNFTNEEKQKLAQIDPNQSGTTEISIQDDVETEQFRITDSLGFGEGFVFDAAEKKVLLDYSSLIRVVAKEKLLANLNSNRINANLEKVFLDGLKPLKPNFNYKFIFNIWGRFYPTGGTEIPSKVSAGIYMKMNNGNFDIWHPKTPEIRLVDFTPIFENTGNNIQFMRDIELLFFTNAHGPNFWDCRIQTAVLQADKHSLRYGFKKVGFTAIPSGYLSQLDFSFVMKTEVSYADDDNSDDNNAIYYSQVYFEPVQIIEL